MPIPVCGFWLYKSGHERDRRAPAGQVAGLGGLPQVEAAAGRAGGGAGRDGAPEVGRATPRRAPSRFSSSSFSWRWSLCWSRSSSGPSAAMARRDVRRQCGRGEPLHQRPDDRGLSAAKASPSIRSPSPPTIICTCRRWRSATAAALLSRGGRSLPCVAADDAGGAAPAGAAGGTLLVVTTGWVAARTLGPLQGVAVGVVLLARAATAAGECW